MHHANIAVLDSVEWEHEFGREMRNRQKMMNLWKLVENRTTTFAGAYGWRNDAYFCPGGTQMQRQFGSNVPYQH